jgi:hypothetical protein
MAAEATHVGNRTNWLLGFNSFLTISFVAAANQASSIVQNYRSTATAVTSLKGAGVATSAQTELRRQARAAAADALERNQRITWLIAGLGLLLSICVLVQLGAAVRVTNSVRDALEADFKEPPECGHCWATLHGTAPDIRGAPWPHRVGLYLPCFMAGVMAIAWAGFLTTAPTAL